MKHIALNTYIVCTDIHTNRTQLNKWKPIAQFPPKKKKKNQIDSTKLNYRVPNPKTYLSVCTNSIINTKRNTAKPTIHILVANRM